jgi:hypothetical protein
MSEPELLDLAALAARWGVTENEARRVVRIKKVPFIRMTSSDRINWRLIRFRLSEVRAWEAKAEEQFQSRAKQSNKKPAKRIAVSGSTIMGDWRKSSPTS